MTEPPVSCAADHPARVFVVEDESLVRLMLVEMLNELGHTVVAEAHRFDSAAEIAQRGDYEIAVLDLNLGDGPRYELLEMVLDRGKGLVVATGYGKVGLPAKFSDCIVLQKPYTEQSLAAALRLTREAAIHMTTVPGQ
jgi:CheY-like chemotaxis protein